MKFYCALCLLAVLAFSQLTPAAPPVPAKVLGHLDATVNFCARVDSASADKYKEIVKGTVKGMSEKELAEARSSAEYKQTYAAITTEREKIPEEKAVESCRAVLKDANK
jgi:hypothetical protein